ncbi:hypothetical protein M0805_009488 [Coniferiporia weirii]|nr:hypothetical protein M0805_009488 [Coniferiporia weirii]
MSDTVVAKTGPAPLFIPHIPRAFTNYPGATYILPSDEEEAKRLRLQHKVLKVAYEGKVLLPPFKDQSSYFVLDSGAGPAIWLLDACSRLSSTAILHGIDIESRLFPPSYPPNISFSIASVTALPEEWTNKFDFVHQRLLMAALKRNEWPVALKQIFRVLSPGGWVQLGEFGEWRAGPINKKHAVMHRALFDSRNLCLDIYADLPRLLEEAGFTNIKVEKRTIPLGARGGQQGIDSRDNLISVFRAMKTPILRSGGLGFVSTEKDFDQLLDSLEKEWDETEGAGIDAHIIYAQRSM